MTTTTCPHNEAAAVRSCRGCGVIDDGSGMVACEGEIEGRVIRDSEGDAGVIGGINTFWAVEDEEASCGCTLTDAEWDKVRERLVEAIVNE